ncbi:MAG: AMP-binding protein [Acidobacteria bacterium]|nr:AMP-binding protein [Acidobacteriota bacterium]
MRTLVDVFRSLEKQRGEFVIHDDGYRVRRFTYAQVTRAARAFAGYLERSGLRPGDHMLLWGENAAEWLVCYWGAVIAGVIVVPIDYRSSVAFAVRIASIVDAKLVCAGQDVPDARGADGFPQDIALQRFADLDWTTAAPMPAHQPSRDDIAQIVFTSGATAEPKGVIVRHKNLLANLTAVSAEISRYKKWARPVLPLRFLNLLPLSHLFGQSMATNIPPLVDGTVVFMRSVNPHDIVQRVKQWRVSVIVCVPKILDVLRAHVVRMDRAAETPATGLSIPARWWRYRAIHRAFGYKFWAFVVGAAPLGSDLEEFWKRLGFVVIQGYGLTETAPIVTLNHPFKTRTGSVGTPVEGVEVRIADDGEILVRGENVTEGYFETKSGRDAAPSTSRLRDAEGWLHTGDVGELDADGRLFIRGRKKEMIVTPDGLNVFPDDVERVVNAVPGVVESAVIGRRVAGNAAELVHAVMVLEPGITMDSVIAAGNARLADHQRIRSGSIWTSGPLPRTEGTQKIKRAAIRAWVDAGASPDTAPAAGDGLDEVLARFTAGREAGAETTLEALGLSSLERVELMVALEDRLQTRIDESRFAGAQTLGELRALVETSSPTPAVEEPVHFPRWNRRRIVGWIRRASLATWILPPLRLAATVHVHGLEHLRGLKGPVIFASNHQSHLDVPVILSALPGHWRARVAPAMAKEFFKAHFFPEGVPWRQVFTNRANYYLAAFFFNAFPLPQREAGARQTLRYIGEVTGEGFSVLIFPEGVRSASGDIKPFRGGVGMMAARLHLPVVPIRLDGVDRILPTGASRIRPGTCDVTFGAPLHLGGDDYAAQAREVEEAVRNLPARPRA